MTTIVLTQPIQRQYQFVEVAVGDYVKVTEWDGIIVKGLVSEITEHTISVKSAQFMEGCYPECDYSYAENQTAFTFDLCNVASIDIAKFKTERLTFEKLVAAATNQNYCGSEKIIMSQLFWQAYKKEVRDSKMFYCQYPIEIDETVDGLYVYAVPNADSIEHRKNPVKFYRLEFFVKNKEGKLQCIAGNILSQYEDELNASILASAKRAKGRALTLGMTVDRVVYRAKHEGVVVKRGIIK